MRNVYFLYTVLLLLLSGGCAPIIVLGPSYPPPQQEPPREYHAIHIPKGHLPPPGHCRIWYPNKPAGHQPPPQRCPIPLRDIPLGAYVVSRAEDNKRCIVRVYHERQPGVVIDTQYLSIEGN